MALRFWKRKLPDREEKAYKIEVKVEQGVFDKKVLILLDSLFRKKILKSIDYCVSTGKEADVFRGTDFNDNFVAIKIFRTYTGQFHRFDDYWDESMAIKMKKKNSVIDLWCSKEFKVLQLLSDLEIAPQPIYRLQNINVMSFLGENGIPYSLIKDIKEDLDQKTYDAILSSIKKMYVRGIVHSDLSEYNIMYDDNSKKVYFIDFAQAVSNHHRNAEKFLRRDVENINKFFKSINNIEITESDQILKQILELKH
ncbi:MAG: hypothetical protein N3E37_04155 [Candidatus Micrarchaeota archaeon]|nr:hypothetical protein [Candidatus Micrarchaeota archaeon]